MSGLEVIGVVLGAIPLVLEVVKKYQSTTDYRRELKTLKRCLETDYVILQDTCEKLLISIVPVHEIASFLKDPFGPLWKTEDTQALIRRRLWNSYRLFEETVLEMKHAITSLGKILGVNIMTQAGMITDPKSTTSRLGGKFVLFLKRAQVESCLKLIEKGNATLTKLLSTSVDQEVEVARQSQSRGRYLKLARQCSSNALLALETSITCPCRTQHNLNLKLPLLSSFPTPTDNDQDIVSNVIFEVTFVSASLASLDHSAILPQPMWKELEIHTHSLEQKTLLRAETLQNMGEKLSKMNLNTSSTENDIGPSPPLLPSEPLEIKDLCGTIDAARKITSKINSYGLIKADLPLIKHIFQVKPQRHISGFGRWSGESLENLLTSRSQGFEELRFRHKHILATKVASSVLQFSESRWLPNFLTSADIAFMEKADSSVFEHPFVIKRLQTGKVAPQRNTERASGLPHELLFSLGVVLLEVALGKSLHYLRQNSGESDNTAIRLLGLTADRDLLDDYELAIKHLNQVEQAMGTHYAQAVRHCLKCEFMSPVLDLGQDEFREEVYRKVVAPLEENVSGLNMKFKAS